MKDFWTEFFPGFVIALSTFLATNYYNESKSRELVSKEIKISFSKMIEAQELMNDYNQIAIKALKDDAVKRNPAGTVSALEINTKKVSNLLESDEVQKMKRQNFDFAKKEYGTGVRMPAHRSN